MAKAPTDIRSLARAHTATALKVLSSIMNDTQAPAPARASAAQYLLDRGWGKAMVAVEVTQIEPKVIRAPSLADSAAAWSAEHIPEQHTEH